MDRLLLLAPMLVVVLLVSGCTQEGATFALPDTFITMQGPILPIKPSFMNCQGPVFEDDYVSTREECETLESKAYLRLPISLLDYNITRWQETGITESFARELECMGETGKPYCRVLMDNDLVIREGCFETGLDAITCYYAQKVSVNVSHVFTICCKATDGKSGWDTCKSFDMEAAC